MKTISAIILLVALQGSVRRNEPHDANYNPETDEVRIIEKDGALDKNGVWIVTFTPPFKAAPGCTAFSGQHPKDLHFKDSDKKDRLTILGYPNDPVHLRCTGYVPKAKS